MGDRAFQPTFCLLTPFLWGQKQEYTNTWYGIFYENGQKTEVYDVLAACWSPELKLINHAPSLDSIKAQNTINLKNLIVNTNQKTDFNVFVSDKENDKLTYNWTLFPESSDLKSGGDAEKKPLEIFNRIEGVNSSSCLLNAPSLGGNYRIFVTISDGEKIAYANIPFLVREN